MEDGRRLAATKGTSQGAVVSPLLANIYLQCWICGQGSGASGMPVAMWRALGEVRFIPQCLEDTAD